MYKLEKIFNTHLDFIFSSVFKKIIKKDNPIIVDVGVGSGKEVELFLSAFTNPLIIAIEAHPKIYYALLNKFKLEINLNKLLLAKTAIVNSDDKISNMYIKNDDIQSASTRNINGGIVTRIKVASSMLRNVDAIPINVDLLWINTNFSELDVIKSYGYKIANTKIIVCSTCIDSTKVIYETNENLKSISKFIENTHIKCGTFNNHFNSNIVWSIFIEKTLLDSDNFDLIKCDLEDYQKIEEEEHLQTELDINFPSIKNCAKIANLSRYAANNKISKHKFASDRIRGDWLCDGINIENYNPINVNKYKAIIFHDECKEFHSFKGIKVFDVCDKLWETSKKYINLFNKSDLITVPTYELFKYISGVTKTPIRVIPDRHKLDEFYTKIPNFHLAPAKSAVWFGYSHNFHCVLPYLKILNGLNINLVIISDKLPNEIKNSAFTKYTFIKWNISTYIEEISKCDFAILPLNKDYKSDNKDITAKLCGIPVAKTYEDIANLVYPANRKNQLLQFDPSIHDVNISISEYVNSINEFELKLMAYTCICGKYDAPRTGFSSLPVIEYCDNKNVDKFSEPVMNAKIYKILSHKFISSKYSMWVDGNIYPLSDSRKYIELLEDADILVFKHPYRKCIYEEAAAAKRRVQNFQRPIIDEQINQYRKNGMPENFGLAECNMIIRKNSLEVEEFNTFWWAEICKYSHRDQLSFPYVWWKMQDKIKIKFVEGNIRNCDDFKYVRRYK
jgi:hypothetical protein